MARRRAVLAALAAGLAATVAGCGDYDIKDAAQRERLTAIREATDVYKDPNAAIAAGYRPLPGCVQADNEDGAVGLTYVNLKLNQDDEVNLLRPELLFYEERGSEATPTLVGVGYMVPDKDQRPPDTPLGHLDGPIPAVGPGTVDRFEMHAWVHRRNPDGVFATWNPKVKCR